MGQASSEEPEGRRSAEQKPGGERPESGKFVGRATLLPPARDPWGRLPTQDYEAIDDYAYGDPGGPRGWGGRLLASLILALVAALAGGFGVYYLMSGHGPGGVGAARSTSNPGSTPMLTPTPTPSPTPTAPPMPGIGGTFREGPFEFVVNTVQCGIDRIGPDGANGQFCKVSVTASNTDRRPHEFPTSAQRAYDTDGNVHGTKIIAGFLDMLKAAVIGGHTSVTVDLVFEIPEEAGLVRLEIHHDRLSAGVMVDLLSSAAPPPEG